MAINEKTLGRCAQALRGCQSLPCRSQELMDACGKEIVTHTVLKWGNVISVTVKRAFQAGRRNSPVESQRRFRGEPVGASGWDTICKAQSRKMGARDSSCSRLFETGQKVNCK